MKIRIKDLEKEWRRKKENGKILLKSNKLSYILYMEAINSQDKCMHNVLQTLILNLILKLNFKNLSLIN